MWIRVYKSEVFKDGSVVYTPQAKKDISQGDEFFRATQWEKSNFFGQKTPHNGVFNSQV